MLTDFVHTNLIFVLNPRDSAQRPEKIPTTRLWVIIKPSRGGQGEIEVAFCAYARESTTSVNGKRAVLYFLSMLHLKRRPPNGGRFLIV